MLADGFFFFFFTFSSSRLLSPYAHKILEQSPRFDSCCELGGNVRNRSAGWLRHRSTPEPCRGTFCNVVIKSIEESDRHGYLRCPRILPKGCACAPDSHFCHQHDQDACALCTISHTPPPTPSTSVYIFLLQKGLQRNCKLSW